ncbi:MAG TPA: hypothetical protein VGH38_23015 [Bryobacteraceae bacterium]|jgi:hypothetical protein
MMRRRAMKNAGMSTNKIRVGSVWWLDTLELVQLASDQAETRYERDPWEEVIGPWLESKESTTISEVLEKCIGS